MSPTSFQHQSHILAALFFPFPQKQIKWGAGAAPGASPLFFLCVWIDSSSLPLDHHSHIPPSPPTPPFNQRQGSCRSIHLILLYPPIWHTCMCAHTHIHPQLLLLLPSSVSLHLDMNLAPASFLWVVIWSVMVWSHSSSRYHTSTPIHTHTHTYTQSRWAAGDGMLLKIKIAVNPLSASLPSLMSLSQRHQSLSLSHSHSLSLTLYKQLFSAKAKHAPQDLPTPQPPKIWYLIHGCHENGPLYYA